MSAARVAASVLEGSQQRLRQIRRELLRALLAVHDIENDIFEVADYLRDVEPQPVVTARQEGGVALVVVKGEAENETDFGREK